MSIIVNGNVFRTLAEPLYVNGKHVIEAYANGEKVYPADDLSGYFMKIRGKTSRHVKTFRLPFQIWEKDEPAPHGWYHSNYGASDVEYDFSVSFAALIEFPNEAYYYDDPLHVRPPKIVSLPKPTIEKSTIKTSYDPYSFVYVPAHTVNPDYDKYINSKYNDRYVSQEGWKIHACVKNHDRGPVPYYRNKYLLEGTPDHSSYIFCSLIFKFNISNSVFTAKTEYYETFHSLISLKMREFPSCIPFNVTKFNGTYGPYYESYRNPSFLSERSSDRSMNDQIIYLSDPFIYPYHYISPRFLYSLKQDENFSENQNFWLTLDHFNLDIGFRGAPFLVKELRRIPPPPGVDYAWETFSVVDQLSMETLHRSGSSPYTYDYVVCPITDILYAGDYTFAPKWATTLTQEDLL